MEPIKKRDAQIQQDVVRRLKWDARVEGTGLGVEVDDGVLTLIDTVSGWAKRSAVQTAAHRVAGVLDVANDIEVEVSGSLVRSNTEIAQAVRQALMWDVCVPDQRIQSTVSDGWATLERTVEVQSEREDAQRAVRNLSGVRGVINKITVAAVAGRVGIPWIA